MISEIPRKSLPAIARTVGLKDGQDCIIFADTPWNVKEFREMRLWIILVSVGDRTIKYVLTKQEMKRKELQLIM